MIKELTGGLLETDQELQLIQTVQTKLQALDQGATQAMSNMDSAEAKRYSARVRGIQNDIYSLNEITRERYTQYTLDLESDIQQTWQIALAGLPFCSSPSCCLTCILHVRYPNVSV